MVPPNQAVAKASRSQATDTAAQAKAKSLNPPGKPAGKPAGKPKPNKPAIPYAPGARVEVRGEEWIVRRAQLTTNGASAVEVVGQSPLVQDQTAIFLDDLDTISVLRPEDTRFVADPSPQYRRTKLYLESLLRQSPPTEASLTVGHLGAMQPAEYQHLPATRALKAPRARLLIADAVGLGKTIEVGILLTELIRRGKGRRILVVALKSVLEQFQKELWSRFTLPLVRLDSVGLERVQRQIPANHNPFYRFDRVIISVDTLKKDEKYRRFLEAAHWDVIVIDECQHVAERGRTKGGGRSQRARLARILANTCDSLLLTSATPHDGSPESFASLMNLLDPTAVADPENFTREDVDHLYVRRFKKDIVAEANSAFSERQLHPQSIEASPAENAVFEALANATFSTVRARLPGSGTRSVGTDPAALFRTLLVKSFLSSPSALASTLQNRLSRQQEKLRKLAEAEEASGTPAANAHAVTQQALQADEHTLQELLDLCDAVTPTENTKLQRLMEVLQPLGYERQASRKQTGAKQPGSKKAKPRAASMPQRVVIFSERIATLEFLQQHLTEAFGLAESQVGVFHGSLDDVDQHAMVREFGSEKGEVCILLASDAASEGINLHHRCNTLVHYDIPWSLITLEQRNGRIDRYGQTKQPELHYLLSKPENPELQGDLRVLDVLVEKEAAAHKNLGDARWLMGLSDALEEEAQVMEGISRHATPEEILQPAEPPKQLSLMERLMSATTFGGAANANRGAADANHSASDGAPSSKSPALLKVSDSGEQAAGQGASALAAHPLSSLPPPMSHPVGPFRLYPNDLAYLQAAFEELVDSQPAELPTEHRLRAPEPQEHLQGLTLHAPPDLQQRYEYLPPELRRAGNSTFTLSANRQLVQDSLRRAREQDAWPELELLWEMHPIAGWVNDRVVCHFGRHEAPVVRVEAGLAAGEWVYVFQGVLSNENSAPVLVQWFGVRTFAGSKSATVESLENLARLTGLDSDLVNRTTPFDEAELQKRLASAVQAAEGHMKALRQKRARQLLPELKQHKKKLAEWKAKREATVLRLTEAATAGGRQPTTAQQQRLEEEARHTERVCRDRDQWLSTLKTSEQPYLRLAAVLGAKAPAKASAKARKAGR